MYKWHLAVSPLLPFLRPCSADLELLHQAFIFLRLQNGVLRKKIQTRQKFPEFCSRVSVTFPPKLHLSSLFQCQCWWSTPTSSIMFHHQTVFFRGAAGRQVLMLLEWGNKLKVLKRGHAESRMWRDIICRGCPTCLLPVKNNFSFKGIVQYFVKFN